MLTETSVISTTVSTTNLPWTGLISNPVLRSEMPAANRLSLRVQSVPRSKHSLSVIQTTQLMLYREIIAVSSEIHTKHINTLCGQNVELLNVKPGGL